MSFSDGQLKQWGNAVEAAGWTAEDITLMGQAGRDRLVGIRDSFRRGGDIIAAIIEGRTELWLHDDQKVRWTRGRVIYSHLQDTGLLAGCVDLDELKAIQAKGIEFFRNHFAGKVIFGWRGVQDGYVPYLFEGGFEVFLVWLLLDDYWFATSQLCVASKCSGLRSLVLSEPLTLVLYSF